MSDSNDTSGPSLGPMAKGTDRDERNDDATTIPVWGVQRTDPHGQTAYIDCPMCGTTCEARSYNVRTESQIAHMRVYELANTRICEECNFSTNLAALPWPVDDGETPTE